MAKDVVKERQLYITCQSEIVGMILSYKTRGRLCFHSASVRPLCSLCLCGEFLLTFVHHRDTENTEDARRISKQPFSEREIISAVAYNVVR